ncbi:E3 SUMO-protein ligase RanBP2-like isoform X2 [Saccostrea echinata]|uniref:E3 SUMO-protein ligase RanBP2-like isoform X2 n=1 Tax=Saccostrea echinata TaxID=191078 RepID=UPI002A832171|nr:E3 SUMO-protein ligase RanBP2-like isoform X2 [Saccostrea echinata]
MSISTPQRSRGTNRCKEDVDRFVDRIQESERAARGYQIGLLYYEVKEYDKAKRYVEEHMAIRPRIPQTHKLLGQIEEACHHPDRAIEAYKRSLELDGKQKALILKICELYDQVKDEDPQVLKDWYKRGERFYPSHPAIFRLKERVISRGDGDVKDMEKFYLTEINKNQDDVTLHSKLLEVYLQSEKTLRDAYRYCTDPTKFNKFLGQREWLETVIKVFEAYEKKEQVSTDSRFQTQKLMVLIDLLYCQLTGNDLMTCVSLLHQLDQNLFSASLLSSTKPDWQAFLKEVQGQLYFLFGLMLYKRAEKRQISWRDASSFAAVCFMVSCSIPLLETRSSWYKMMNADQRKMFGRLRRLSCYRLSQGGYLLLPLTERGNVTRMKEYRQLQTGKAVDRMYELMFTLREMRNKAMSSFIVVKDLFIATTLVAPSRQSLETYDEGVFSLHEGNLQELVWIALNRYSSQEVTQKSYPLCIPEKIPLSTPDLSSAAPESLCQLDIMAFFIATVKCAASAFEERCKVTRFDQYQPRLLPACFRVRLCTESQCDWWTAMYKFCHNLARDQTPRLRLVIQKGLETVRLLGTHGVSVALIIHLARTFDERVKELKALELEQGDKLHAFERRAAHYWQEATLLLSRMERKLNIPLPRDRIFTDDRPMDLDENQIQDLIEQSKFSLATVAMREGHLEEAREQFLKLKIPWASYYLSQIYRTMADEIHPSDDESTNQKLALVEQSLDALYQTLEKIQGEKNHELHRIIPNDIDECVCELENLRRASLGVSVVDSVSGYEDAKDEVSGSDEDTPSYSTPKASHHTQDYSERSQSPLSGLPSCSSTPAVKESSSSGGLTNNSTPVIKGKSPANVHFSFSERGRTRPSPERLEARLWALEAKQQTTLDLMTELKEQLKEMREDRARLRELERRMMDHIMLCSSRPQPPQPYIPPHIPPPPLAYPSQVPALPAQYPYPPNSWVQSSYNYTQSVSPIPGGGPMSNRRQYGRGSQLRPEYEEDIYQFGEDLYEDDGSQPLPAMCPEPQLVQDWPFGNKAGVEGKSTITYSPQPSVASRIPAQSGFLANNLRGQAIQYHASAHEQKPMPGPGFFSSPKPEAPPSASVIAQALAKSGSPSVTPAPSLPGQPSPSISAGLSSTGGTVGSSLPLFGSLMAASKSPDKVMTGELAGHNEPGKFSFLPSTVSTSTTISQGGGTTSQSGVPATQSSSMPFTFMGFGAKPQVPTSSVSATSTSASQLGGGSVFSFSKPVFGTTPTSTTSSETSATSSPFASFTGFGSSNLPSFSALTTDKAAPGFGTATTPVTSPVKPIPANTSSHSTPSPRKRNDSMTMEEYEPNVDFKPVIDLPNLVEVKSGEEEEEVLFCQRAKLFRFDADASQWKERGIGEMKILKHRVSNKSRIMMRREQVLKLCANHQITKDLKLTTMGNSDKTWCWVANDYSEEELKVQSLAVRFKTTEQAERFKEVFEKCQSEADNDSSTTEEEEETSPTEVSKEDNSETKMPEGKQMSLKEMFRPKEGTWTCETCMVPNERDAIFCLACNTGKPGVDPKLVKEAVKKSAPTTEKPSLAAMFKPKPGSWSCEGCLIQNEADKLRCVACNALKPGVKPEDVKDDIKGSGVQSSAKSGFSFKTSSTGSVRAVGGFVFGTTTANSAAPSGGFVFGTPSTTTSSSSSGVGFAFGTSTTKTTTTSTVTAASAGGFTFGKTATADSTKTSGFTFGTPDKTTADSTTTSSFNFGTLAKTTAADPTPTSAGFSFGSPSTQTASAKPEVLFGSPSAKPEVTSASITQTGPSGPGFVFGTSASKTTGSSESTGFNFGGIKSSGFAFGSQSSKEEKADSSADADKKTEAKPEDSKSEFDFGSSRTAGFTFGQKSFNFGSKSPEQKPDSTTAATSTQPKSAETPKPEGKKEDSNPTAFKFSKEPPVFGADSSSKSGFQFKLDSASDSKDKSSFKFTFSPPKPSTTVPGSPEVDKEGMYINKEGEDDHIYFEPVINLPEKVDVVTGEENETVLFAHRAKLYRFHNNEWKERGLGDIKILENEQTKKIRILMRREQIHKICCNHYITKELDLKPMPNSNGKAWIWFAMDHSDEEPKYENFSVRFKTPDIANRFKEAFDNAKQKVSTPSSTPGSPAVSAGSCKPPTSLQSLLSEDEDVVVVQEEKATPDQIEQARKFMLPDHFYLYEKAPPCPGCIGCEDYKEGTKISRKTRTPTPKKIQDEMSSSSSSGGIFGASAAPPGGLFGAQATGGGDTGDTPSLFGQGSTGGIFGGGGVSGFSFSGLAASSGTDANAFKKDDSKPFNWMGAGQKLFTHDDREEEGDEVAQGEDPHFEPVVPLPDLVEVKTGEEDHEKIFSHRAKLFRYDGDTKQWKEKGIGEMKILRHTGTGQYRLLLRREQVLKLACNQKLTSDLKFQPMATSETAWCWVGQDFSDNEPKLEQLAVKFKSIDLAKEFKAKIDECQKNLIENPPQDSTDNQQTGISAEERSTEERPGEEDDDEYEDVEDDDDDEYDDVEEEILLEKRVTFQMMEDDQWKKCGTGVLKVISDDDVNGHRVIFTTDKKENLCNHIIAVESSIVLDKKQHFCEWHPIDFATDEPVRRGFRAIFSSVPAAEEFHRLFQQGRTLAHDMGISERGGEPHELKVPEVHGQGVNDD